jgi:hypothetical protein
LVERKADAKSGILTNKNYEVMKKNFYLAICSILLLLSGCYDRDIIDSKEGEPLDPVTNLTYTIDGSNVNLSWTLPSQYPSDIITPVAVQIKVYRNNVLLSTLTVIEDPVTYTYTPYSSDNVYRFILKVTAAVNTTDPNKSKLRYSPGVTVYID